MFKRDIIFGVHIPPEEMNFETLKAFCLTSEKMGYDLFTLSDHFFNVNFPEKRDHPLESWRSLAAIATMTEEIKIGPCVLCYAYRTPTILAKMATTLDVISNGRLVFGVGAGWHEGEFMDFLGRFPPMDERMIGLEETIQICKSMFTRERTSFKGKMFQVNDVLNSPLPIQKPPLIMIGGHGKRMLKIVARYADISHFALGNRSIDLEFLDRKLQMLKNNCKKVGRRFNEIIKGITLLPVTGETEEDVERRVHEKAKYFNQDVQTFRELNPLVGTPEQCVKIIKAYTNKRVDLFSLKFYNLKDIEFFAEKVMRKL